MKGTLKKISWFDKNLLICNHNKYITNIDPQKICLLASNWILKGLKAQNYNNVKVLQNCLNWPNKNSKEELEENPTNKLRKNPSTVKAWGWQPLKPEIWENLKEKS